jgi:predicted transposase YdaD
MQDTIHKTMENVLVKSKEEVGFTMTTNIIETLPWIDYRELFVKLEERGRAEGEARGEARGKAKGRAEGRAEGRVEGKAERDMEIALKMFTAQRPDASQSALIQTLQDLGISDQTIEAARKQAEAERAQ